MNLLRNSALRHYWFTLAITAVVFAGVFFKAGGAALWSVFILAIIEITFSFDNAVLNSEVLGRMAKVWRKVFLTVGIAIAVFGVRLLLPLVLVGATTGSGIGEVFSLAVHDPDAYAEHVHEAYPIIAAFGGIFLLMIGLRFLAEERDIKWLPLIEHTMSRPQRPWLIPIGGALLATATIGALAHGDRAIIISALCGIAVFVIVKGLSVLLESGQANRGLAAASSTKTNLINFMYLELLDASFSFDGVVRSRSTC